MIKGVVINGEGLGRRLGWPTANLNVSPEDTHLSSGIYAAYAFLNDTKYQAALVIGKAGQRVKVEVYLIDYAGADFYGETLSVEAIQQVSQLELKESIDELREKIGEDMELIRAVFYGERETS